jgi:hypothetical protein
MANAEVVVYNIAVFIATLFVLEFGADKFIDHTAVVARRTGIPEMVIGLLTAGGEWEEVPSHRYFIAQNLCQLSLPLLLRLLLNTVPLWPSATSLARAFPISLELSPWA